MGMTAKAGRFSGMDWKFMGLFALYLAAFVGLAQIPPAFYDAASRFTAAAAALFWQLFRVPVSSLGSSVTFYDFTMKIIFECTGLHYAAIFSAAVLAYRGRTVAQKSAGLCAGIGLIFILNMLRLGTLGFVGHYASALFSFVHLYLWHALFTLAVLLIWIWWVNERPAVSRRLASQILAAVATATFTFWLLYFEMDRYFVFLAAVADLLFPLISGALSMPDSIIAEGELIGYVSGNYVIYSTTGLYALNFAVYFALAAASAVPPSKRSLPLRICAGMALMLIFHLSLLLADWMLEVASDDTVISLLRETIVLSSMAAPVASWFLAGLFFRSRPQAAGSEDAGE